EPAHVRSTQVAPSTLALSAVREPRHPLRSTDNPRSEIFLQEDSREPSGRLLLRAERMLRLAVEAPRLQGLNGLCQSSEKGGRLHPRFCPFGTHRPSWRVV